ncbi:cache domain-containing protein [Pseudodesulfovibrio sp. zrk46]|uniref:cache domain-containing protein n=1 Tax=Pseudodesulfovibrio sp. zrk46 TaxID=2725288 RepID=UPI001448B23E|nr:cache domain-containing protein [Pseudodesulfovibrio sp. zrk46]QJB55778.1 hypothetical protein HFN16_04885 [Pseudodesulfovibrio sp. zrk46]
MSKSLSLAAVVLLIVSTFALAGSCEQTAQDLVSKGVIHIKAVGAKQAAADFMDPDGEFIDGDYYLLFYTFDGNCLALGAKPEVAGKNRWNVHDPDGVYQIREMVNLAKMGGGWVEYKYANPSTGKVQPKKTYVRPVPNMDAFVGCGIYYK